MFVCAWLTVMYIFFYNEETLVKKAPHAWLINHVFRKPPPECLFPRTDPFDPSLDDVVRTFPPLDCSNQTANIVYLEKYVLYVNYTKLPLVLSAGQIFSHCWYKEIIRQKDWDTRFNFSWTSENFTKSIALPAWNEHIVSECFDANKTVLSRSYFHLIRKKPDIEKEQHHKYLDHVRVNSPLETLSFFIIGIDGMSKQNFERAMPKTRNFLIDKMGAIELYKYNKLAFETFPNVLALLTGHTPEEFYRDWKYNRTGYVDQINDAFLWTEARKLGYRTAMMLDAQSITAFHYQKKGFNERPVHYYQRETVLASTRDKLMRGEESNCLGDVPEVTVVHEPWLQIARTFGKDRTTPFFAYSFAVGITHDESDLASKGDEAYHKFLHDLVATDSLNNTVIVWFSDHGPRFGPIRETYHGRIETSTPYIFFVFPPWFKRKYPHLMKTLEINRNRLSSHFDLHETLRDLMYMRKGQRPKGTVKERAISLFREIPRERTCAQAGIPGEFCVCGRFYEPKLTQATYYMLALTLLEKMNSFVGFATTKPVITDSGSIIQSTSGDQQLLKNHPMSSNNGGESPTEFQISGIAMNKNSSESYGDSGAHASSRTLPPAGELRKLCAHLNLHKVESVYQITNDQLQSLKVKTYRVTIRTMPGSGLFEGLVNYDEASGSAQVMGDVVRINMYRGQADCVVDPWLRQFCFCLK
ncbi:hypothetical protein ElyMa_005363900 [Elysia marginata]|uniref:Sulfatase N-terminal domain-containing protein n=1 Tax=Elysia marginata TaxID=1093978 RepID=A0AAV4ECN6_9GAST|nr:hypothetical protein ElyMa_005363900 [Elysia marginata]